MATIGFDFGTTNSLLSVIRGGRAISFLDEAGLPTPSAVCYEGARTIVGREAKERMREAGLGIKGNVVRSPKTLLGRESVFIEGVERSPVEITAEVVRHVVQVATAGRRRDLQKVDTAVVTIPVNMDGLRRTALRDAFRRAGIRIRQFVHEPLAALYGHLRSDGSYADLVRQFDKQLLLVVDWGGGTLDVTLCRLFGGTIFQVANDGTDEVGGDVFDDTLREETVKRVIARRGFDARPPIRPDAMTRLLHACERAKIDLSNRSSASIYVSSFFRDVEDDSLEDKLTQEDLERICGPLLDRGLSRISNLLTRAGVSPAQVKLCLAVGGMSNMPAVRERLHEWFGLERVHVSDKSASLIAEGAAWIAHDDAEIQLAKQVELVLARMSQLTLLDAGFRMPREGEARKPDPFHLYCVDPRDAIAKFQLLTPERPGPARPGDPRRVLCTLGLAVDDRAKPFQERLELEVQVNEDLILKIAARSLNRGALARAEIHDLEFSLKIPGADSTANEQAEESMVGGITGEIPKGALAIRANVANRVDPVLVPGELLYTYDRIYFDRRSYPPEFQVEELLYYEPCSCCGRASNDPLCTCASNPNTSMNRATRGT